MAETTPAVADLIPVTVVVAPRPDFDGYWAIGQKFNVGKTDLEVTPEQLASLRRSEKMKLPIAVIEYSQAEMAARRSSVGDKEAEAASAAAEKAIVEAQAKAEAAKKLKDAAEAAAEAAKNAPPKPKTHDEAAQSETHDKGHKQR